MEYVQRVNNNNKSNVSFCREFINMYRCIISMHLIPYSALRWINQMTLGYRIISIRKHEKTEREKKISARIRFSFCVSDFYDRLY